MSSSNTLSLCARIVHEIEIAASQNEVQADHVLTLCDDIVASVEFGRTHLGKLVSSGVKVRFESVTLHG